MEEVQGQRESGPRDRPGTDRYALQLRVCRSGLGSKCRLERCWLGERGLLRRIEGTPTFAGARAEGRTSAWGGGLGKLGKPSICAGSLDPLAHGEGQERGLLSEPGGAPGGRASGPRGVLSFSLSLPSAFFLPFSPLSFISRSGLCLLVGSGSGMTQAGTERQSRGILGAAGGRRAVWSMRPWNPVLTAFFLGILFKRQAVPKRWALDSAGKALI